MNLFGNLNGTLAVVCTAILSGADVYDSSTLRRMPHGHALLCEFVTDLAFGGFIKVEETLPSPYLVYCGKKSEIASLPRNMCLLGLYTWDNRAMVPQIQVNHSSKELSLHADAKGEITQMATARNGSPSVTTGTAVPVTKFDISHFREVDLFLTVN